MAEGTLTELRDALWDNASFEEDSSATKAKAFITAATRWLALEAGQQSDQGSSLTYSHAQVEKLLQRARQYIAANPATTTANTSRVRFLSAGEGFRR